MVFVIFATNACASSGYGVGVFSNAHDRAILPKLKDMTDYIGEFIDELPKSKLK